MGLADWQNFQPHSLRALFTTRLSNDKSVNDQERMVSCRHTSVAANAIYQEADITSEANKFAALGIKPNAKKLLAIAAPTAEIVLEDSVQKNNRPLTVCTPRNATEDVLTVVPVKVTEFKSIAHQDCTLKDDREDPYENFEC